jgi:hypothetical protein
MVAATLGWVRRRLAVRSTSGTPNFGPQCDDNSDPARYRRGRVRHGNHLARPAGRSQSLRVAVPVAHGGFECAGWSGCVASAAAARVSRTFRRHPSAWRNHPCTGLKRRTLRMPVKAGPRCSPKTLRPGHRPVGAFRRVLSRGCCRAQQQAPKTLRLRQPCPSPQPATLTTTTSHCCKRTLSPSRKSRYGISFRGDYMM